VTSYHVHSRWSDGVASIEEIVREADRLELDEVGISDHYVLYPDGTPIEWSMPPDQLDAYVDEVLGATRHAQGVRVRLGIEVDFLPETIEAVRERLRVYPFDYVIGSVHFIDGFPIDEHRKYWDTLSPAQINETWRAYYRRATDMAKSGVFDIAAHLDLPRKFGHVPTDDLTADVHAVLDAIAASNMAIEINTSGWSLPANEAYPAPWIVVAARERNIPIVITADAHTPKYLTRGFERARQLAEESGYSHVACYERRARVAVRL
jgi:histidinol-phosphatase (PHP family)